LDGEGTGTMFAGGAGLGCGAGELFGATSLDATDDPDASGLDGVVIGGGLLGTVVIQSGVGSGKGFCCVDWLREEPVTPAGAGEES